jgi:surface protein
MPDFQDLVGDIVTDVAFTSGDAGSGPAPAPAEFTIVMRTTGASETVVLPMTGNNNLDIDWGDGSAVETGVTSDDPSHVYATADDYTIKVTGDTDRIHFDGSGSEGKLIQVVAGGTDLNYNGVTASDAFRDCSNLESADFSGLDTSGIVNMLRFFQNCSSLTSVDVTGFDTSSVDDMGAMFANCSSLTSLDLSSLDTSSVTDMGGMFLNCSSLTSLDVTNFDTSSVTGMITMFRGCSSLASLDVSGFDTSSVITINLMFFSCQSLTSDPGIVNWDFSAVSSANNFTNGADAMLSTAEYNAILVKMAADRDGTPTANWHFGDATYDASAGGNDGTAARATLIGYGDTITDGGPA